MSEIERLRLAQDIQALRRLEQSLRPGVWQAGVAGNCDLVSYDGDDISGIAQVGVPELVAFIAAARNTLPALLLEIELLWRVIGTRDRDWCLAFAEAVPATANLQAPITPEGVKMCIDRLLEVTARPQSVDRCGFPDCAALGNNRTRSKTVVKQRGVFKQVAVRFCDEHDAVVEAHPEMLGLTAEEKERNW